MTPTAARTVRSIAVIAILAGAVGVCLLLALGGYIDADPARHGSAVACFLGALGSGCAIVAGICTLVRIPRPAPQPTLPAARIVDR